MKITDPWLQNAKPKAARYDVTVTGHPGLMVRVHSSGEISFRFRYRRLPRHYVMVLGRYGKDGISLAEAQGIATAARRELERGLDPIEERQSRERATESAREEHAAAGTVEEIVEQFVHRKLRAERWDAETAAWMRDAKTKTKPRKRPDVAAKLLESNLVAVLGTQKAKEVTRRQLVKLLDDIVDRPAPVLANRVHALMKQCFDYAAAKDLIPASPMAGIERPGGEETKRDRILNDDEIRLFWSKVEDPKAVAMSKSTRLALQLLLVTAQRRAEITFAKWEHFDSDAAMWTIPATLSKNAKAHSVPLSALALELLGKLKAISKDSPWVLPTQYGIKKQGASYSERVLSRAVRNNHDNEKWGIAHFTPHDLRRTASSYMTRIGVPRLHVEKVLNHSVADIAEIYDRHTYLPEKRIALDRWSTELANILANKERKVVPLERTVTAAPVVDDAVVAARKSAGAA